MSFVIRTLVTAASLWVATLVVPGITVGGAGFSPDPQTDRILALVLSAFVLGLLNAIVKPLLVVLSLPITCATLGLFILVVNGVMLVLLSLLPLGFHVDGLFSAIVGALVVSVVSFVLHRAVPG